jgi:FtsZ-binding cell division protein ZapB
MSQTFWESEVVEEQQEEQPLAEPRAEELLSPPELQQPEPQLQEPVAEPETLAMSRDDFSALEERVVQAVNLVKRERLARAEAEERAAQAEAQLREQAPLVEHLQKELNALRAERDHVRQRVERLLAQLDALEL